MHDAEKIETHEKKSGDSAYGRYTILSVRGASHVRNHQPCQDAFDCLETNENSNQLIIAIADGHGDKRHDMSHHGAKFATKIAVRILNDLYNDLKQSKTHLFRSFRDDFLKEVVKQWKKEVFAHAEKNGLDTEEPSKVYTRYGTTLLVALVGEDEALVGQIGDGDILIIDETNRPIIPINKGDDLIGNSTHSLCSTEANHFWNTARIPNPLNNKFFMMSTDGLSNCFADDENFHKFALSLAEYVSSHNTVSIDDTLATLLFDYSNKGSGDDITLALLKFKNRHVPKEERTSESDELKRNQPTIVLPTDERHDEASLPTNIYHPLYIGPSLEVKYQKIGKNIYKPIPSPIQKWQGPRYNIRAKDELQ